MSDADDPPIRYSVSCSRRVTDEFRRLLAQASERGMKTKLQSALAEINRRLAIYPQFGQPISDLNKKPLQIWIGVVAPLVVRYVLDDDNKRIFVGTPMQLLPKSDRS